MLRPPIVESLRARIGVDRGRAGAGRAGVSLVLDTLSEEPALLLIRRAVHPEDPWSGHVALPGGRWQPEDPDLVHTAARETLEEVGVDLLSDGEWIGSLEEHTPVGGTRQAITVLPAVFALRRPVDVAPNQEVGAFTWASIQHLRRRTSRGTYRHMTPNGLRLELPSFQVEDFTVWGLTHRIVSGLLDRL